jgi:hypothetical protein
MLVTGNSRQFPVEQRLGLRVVSPADAVGAWARGRRGRG